MSIIITDENMADQRLARIYTNEEEAVDNMVALVEWFGGDPLRVFEVDCTSYTSGRGYIIMEDGLCEEEEREVQQDLAEENAREVIWNPMFEVVGTLTYDVTTDHLHGCDKPVASCPECAEHFQLTRHT